VGVHILATDLLPLALPLGKPLLSYKLPASETMKKRRGTILGGVGESLTASGCGHGVVRCGVLGRLQLVSRVPDRQNNGLVKLIYQFCVADVSKKSFAVNRNAI